jgi:hypothetical protein
MTPSGTAKAEAAGGLTVGLPFGFIFQSNNTTNTQWEASTHTYVSICSHVYALNGYMEVHWGSVILQKREEVTMLRTGSEQRGRAAGWPTEHGSPKLQPKAEA